MDSKKHKALSLDTKYQVLTAVDSGVKFKKQIASDFGIPASTLITILKQRENIVSAYNSNVEEALFTYFRGACDLNIPLSGPSLAVKVNEFAVKLGQSNFETNNSWIKRFEQHQGIVSKAVCGESASVHKNVTNSYKETTLPNLPKDYEPKDVTLQMKGESCHRGKRSKERLTVVLCANMDGTDK
ncbi:hypothetical protein KUTeg_001175 [Tegillarca granosa]|uniref:HTH CENPB-type domain-containing protein n=1 Tax=Tegillarca granosa TaxID=220873 RepID=A0ABQ9FWZ8_TEGGR|nr:hypothetical protein KUTeg_001175 [Tegillarca granosa]